jgi:hypothetical protein
VKNPQQSRYPLTAPGSLQGAIERPFEDAHAEELIAEAIASCDAP